MRRRRRSQEIITIAGWPSIGSISSQLRLGTVLLSVPLALPVSGKAAGAGTDYYYI